jgi:glycosyltransferase involved in cell wall biosynthesis/2-polyprenyl-3-methyl-5-hydroxy-6-metoxy-1,4-benzoquinol methylase
MPFDGETVNKSSLGGSESAAFYLARELGRRGHRVSCWTTKEQPENSTDGVSYIWIGHVTAEYPLGEQFEWYARNTPHDVLIIQRHPIAFHKRFAAKVCIWQLHDLALKRYQPKVLAGTWQVDAVTCVSAWHAKQVEETWLLTKDILRVVPNGVDPALYATEPPKKPPAGKFTLLYQSRPERGLEHLVRPGGIMDRCRDLPIHLMVCGYENTTAEMAPFYERLRQDAARLPNVTWAGALTKPQLAKFQQHADVLIYPTEFEEVSCITAMEAMHAGLPMLTSDVGALPETCQGTGTVMLSLKDGKANEDAFVSNLHNIFKPPAITDLKGLRSVQLEAAKSRTWSAACDRLLEVIEECFARHTGNAGAVLRHAIEHSDIDFAAWFLNGHLGDTSSIARAAIDEIDRLYAFTESDAAYADHYAKHQGIYYDDHEEQVIGEDVTQSTRFRGVRDQLIQFCQATQNIEPKMLDYGCAHGHYLMPLAKLFPLGKFKGFDVSSRAVFAAGKWAKRDKVENAQFLQRSEKDLVDCEERFDVILAGEVLEHVRDAGALLERLKGLLNEDGLLLITTPVGRWEHSGTEAFRTGREHLRHYERADIEEILAGHQYTLTYAPASLDRSGEPLGSWIWAVRPTPDRPFNAINFERKLKYYAPRETISACLIVRDGEKSLRRCIESFVDWVDEVRIFVDPKTTDRTMKIAHGLREDFPNRAFHIQTASKSATVDGFDAARNESVEGASGDWILWCDADEELHEAWNLHRLARPSLHEGYGCAQIHYSLDPAQVLTTDYPCRFYRNHRDIRFYGLVHEHPEKILGQAIPSSVMRPEVKFLHGGYRDEETRRLRYQRNLPLLLRDREAYPDRKLNKFLWLRDLAQGMIFEQEQMGGRVAPDHEARAQSGIDVFESLIEGSPPRMISDAMPYYSHCVATLGKGFEAKIEVNTMCPTAPDLAAKFSLAGRFHNRKFYQRVAAHLLEESTKEYEGRYL